MLQKRTTLAPWADLERELDSWIHGFFPPGVRARSGAGQLPINLYEDEDGYVLETEVPGLTLDDLDLFVLDRELTLQGERKLESREGLNLRRREISYGRFHRVITLPEDVDPDKVEAELRNGVLTVRLAKAETRKPRKVKVKTS